MISQVAQKNLILKVRKLLNLKIEVKVQRKLKIEFKEVSSGNEKKSPNVDDIIMVNYFTAGNHCFIDNGSVLVTFSSANPHRICYRLRWLLRDEQGRIDTNRFDEENVALNDEILEYKYINPIHNKRTFLLTFFDICIA